MLSADSPLKRLPPDLTPEQTLFFDGLRHAFEIAHFAITRLRTTLQIIAASAAEGDAPSSDYSSAFLDAWAYVDAIDRFRTLWQLCPGFDKDHDATSEEPLQQIGAPIRNLRNVADHLAQRAQYVVAHRGCALGVLSWITLLDGEAKRGRSCVLKPGSFRNTAFKLLNPTELRISSDHPTGVIQLEAGEHTADLLSIYPHVEQRIRHLERALLDRSGASTVPGTSDALLIAEFSAHVADAVAPGAA